MAIINGVTSAAGAEVDSTPKALRTLLYDAAGNPVIMTTGAKVGASQGVLLNGGLNDSFATPLRTDRLGNLLTGNALAQIFDAIEGATINTQKWSASNTTFAPTQSATGLSLNPTSLTTASAFSIYQSFKQLAKLPRVPLQFKARARISTVSNSIAELGFGSPSGTTAVVPNGAFWRMAGSSSVTPVLSFNNTEITGSAVDLSAQTGNHLVYDVIVDDDGAIFTIHDTQNDTLLSRQTLQVQSSWAKMWAVTRLPVFVRLYNTATPPASAPLFIVSELQSLSHDLALTRPYLHTLAMNTLRAGLSPTAFTQNPNYANSAAPSSATLSNTAAGYTNLGGQWQFAAVAGAETDYCLFGFTVPTGYQFCNTGIHIETFNMGAVVATTPTLLQWGVGENGASANLSTGGHIRHALGSQSLPIGTVVGGEASKILDVAFDVPLVTESGRNFAVILKMPVGTATGSQIVRGTCDVRGYFE